jgi:hypothetical protein
MCSRCLIMHTYMYACANVKLQDILFVFACTHKVTFMCWYHSYQLNCIKLQPKLMHRKQFHNIIII